MPIMDQIDLYKIFDRTVCKKKKNLQKRKYEQIMNAIL